MIQGHVAVGIKLNQKIYVLDQQLPILTLDRWKEKWKRRFNKKELKIDLIRVYLEREKIKIRKDNFEIESMKSSGLKIDKLNKDLRSYFKIRKSDTRSTLSLETPLKGLSLLSSEEKIYRKSLFELIKNKIDDEFVDNLKKISYVEVSSDEKDLSLKVWTK